MHEIKVLAAEKELEFNFCTSAKLHGAAARVSVWVLTCSIVHAERALSQPFSDTCCLANDNKAEQLQG